MCILLTRTFKCFPDGTPSQHTFRYIIRCASPRYAECLSPKALAKQSEEYEIACHECTGKFLQPFAKPKRFTQSMVDENDMEARDAAENYAKSMVEFLNMALMEASSPILNNPHDDQFVYRVSKIETACRFDKDHVENGANCECLERDDATKEFNTNRMTELHNTAAAMRRIVSHAYWFPWRGFWPGPVTGNRAQVRVRYLSLAHTQRPANDGELDPEFLPVEQYIELHRQQPDFTFLDNLGNRKLDESESLTVVPVLHSAPDILGRVEVFTDLLTETIESFGGRDGWERSLLTSNFPMTLFAEYAAATFDARMQVSNLVSRLLAHDPGLTRARIASISRIFLRFWHFDTNVMRASFSQDLRRLFDKLVIHTYEAIVQRGSGRYRNGAYAGGMLTSPGHYKHTEYIILRNTSMRLKDEFYRQDLLESVVAPLTKAELQELDLADTDCFVCMEPLGTVQDPHAAVRFKCASEKHVVGKNCWMKSLRRIRPKYNSSELKCPLCSDCVLSDWKTPFNNNHLWAWDVVRSTVPQLAQEMGDAGYTEL
ncbi:hypothetical protein BDP55DRAFT_725448 [Colletotrichum godetiae]|uniref:Uncharacterized protein n=1 Tax=Colletotrichum godetiae TaxID=1209918 RepID=A0AAJ0EZX3_9PEZI|nr:uncharacterized protein BDP55DRAFT_725448 [Colletotrichum godetiae]KAK1690071.1 hypothetical protein BDP55DRAFT_725448 [Colletotrichum godetiae]